MNLFAVAGWLKTVLTAVAVAVFTLTALLLHALGITDAGILLTLLMAVVLSSWAFGLPWSLLASVLVVAVHAYYFSVPIYSFEVSNPQHLFAFTLTAGIGVVVASLSGRLRDQVRDLAVRETRLEALHRVSQGLSGQIDRTAVVATAEQLLGSILQGDVTIQEPAAVPRTGTRAFALTGSQGVLGWLTLGGSSSEAFLPDRQTWIETLLAPVAQARERVELIRQQAERSRILETAQTRNTILHGISHDLRTPLTVVAATADSLLDRMPADDPRRSDLESLASEAQGVVRQVENLLELTSLTAGTLQPRREWVPAEDLVYPCLESVVGRYPSLEVNVQVPPAPALCQVDETLVTKTLANLLENAALYAPGPIDLRLVPDGTGWRFEVQDRGPGVPEAERQSIFGQFVRGTASRKAAGHRGTGLGLALVKTVAELHGGTAGCGPRAGGGSVFWFTLGQTEEAPALWAVST